MRIANDQLAVEIAPLGAELQSIRSADGGDWLWSGDGAFWTGRAPLLFPVVGKSPGGVVNIEGSPYPMQPHGFARRSVFAATDGGAGHARLTLTASETTRKSFPFEFSLAVTYRLEGTTLHTIVEVTNADRRSMPFGFGFHPAFVWPLPGAAGQAHTLRLAGVAEPKYQSLDGDGLIKPELHQSPFSSGELVLDPALFGNDALLFAGGVGDGIVYGASGGASVTLTWSNLPNFAVWTKPGAPFLCLEPWHGMSALAGAGGEMIARPSTIVLPPGGVASFALAATFSPG